MRSVQTFLKTNVLESAKKRISFVFDNCENIHLSVSGGKDSTVIADLVLQEAQRRSRRVGVFFLDEEVVYQSSIEQIEYIIERGMSKYNADLIIPLWLQIQYNTTNATSYSDRIFTAWEKGKHKIWMRSKKSYAIKEKPWSISNEIIHKKEIGLSYYSVITNFERCYNNTAFFVGLRGEESINRWRAVVKNPIALGGKQVFWATRRGNNASFYPIYDWTFADIWKYIYDQHLEYNKVYDWQFKLGIPAKEMRVSSLIHEKAFKSLVELPQFEPDTYNKLVKRISSVKFAQETGRRKKMFKVKKLPKNFKCWIDYRNHLLLTYPNNHDKKVFEDRFAKHFNNEYVARQQCRQLILADVENNLPVKNTIDPVRKWADYYMEVL